ncbi:MAG: hypothetical protein AB1638_12375 [Nitrospirota bacterium]
MMADYSKFSKFFAKSESLDGSVEDLYLITHVREALERLGQLSDYLSATNLELQYDLVKETKQRKRFITNVAKAIILHDLGKISSIFQKNILIV